MHEISELKQAFCLGNHALGLGLGVMVSHPIDLWSGRTSTLSSIHNTKHTYPPTSLPKLGLRSTPDMCRAPALRPRVTVAVGTGARKAWEEVARRARARMTGRIMMTKWEMDENKKGATWYRCGERRGGSRGQSGSS